MSEEAEKKQGTGEDTETRRQGDKETEISQNEAPALNPQLSTLNFFWPFVLLMGLFSTFLQSGARSCEAVIDDHAWLHDTVQRGCGANIKECFLHPQLYYYYRPLLAASFALGERLYHVSSTATVMPPPDEAVPYHLENLVMHGVVVVLVFWLLRLLFRRSAPALIGGTLFALHPLNVPVTTFIGGRTDNMALIFLALFCIGLLKQDSGFRIQDSGQVASDHQPSTINQPLSAICWALLSLLSFTAALFTKEQCVLMVLLVPLMANWHWERIEWRRMAWLGLYLLPVALYLSCARYVATLEYNAALARHDTQKSFFSNAPWGVGLWLEMIGRTCWYYASAFGLPTVNHLHQSTLGAWDWAAFGPLGRNAPGVPAPPSRWQVVGGYAALAFVVWLAGRMWANRAVRFCLLWLFLTLLPCLNLIPVPSQFIAPYRALIPLVGVCGLAGALAAGVYDRCRTGSNAAMGMRIAGTVGAALLLAWCAWGIRVTLADVGEWQDDLTLMQAELRADPNFVPAKAGEAYMYNNASSEMAKRLSPGADPAAARLTMVKKALDSYNAALRQLIPEARTPEDIIRAGRAPDWPRRLASASSLRYNNIPYLSQTLEARGHVERQRGMWNEAAGDFRAAGALDPKDNSIGDWEALALDNAGRWTEEEAVLKAQMARRADSYRLSRLGYLYYRQQKWPQARDMLRAALHSVPSNTGATTDLATAQRQYQEAFVRALPAPAIAAPAPRR